MTVGFVSLIVCFLFAPMLKVAQAYQRVVDWAAYRRTWIEASIESPLVPQRP